MMHLVLLQLFGFVFLTSANISGKLLQQKTNMTTVTANVTSSTIQSRSNDRMAQENSRMNYWHSGYNYGYNYQPPYKQPPYNQANSNVGYGYSNPSHYGSKTYDYRFNGHNQYPQYSHPRDPFNRGYPYMPYNPFYSTLNPSINDPFKSAPPTSDFPWPEKCKILTRNFNPHLIKPRFVLAKHGAKLPLAFVRDIVQVPSVEECEKVCLEQTTYTCKSFNFKRLAPTSCELNVFDAKSVTYEFSKNFEHNSLFDYYEISNDITHYHHPETPLHDVPAECIKVSHTCAPDGMEFTLKTPQGFYGRIYTYGFYDHCFVNGNGNTATLLRVTGPNGFPRCGTQLTNDMMTNIIVVQFNDFVQTSLDKNYNITCHFSGPGETVVTSNYFDTSNSAGRNLQQIEHLPPQNILTSNVVLKILYRGAPVTAIAVGDLLTFRLETKEPFMYDLYHGDIFATNVFARDPYSGREVQLIDGRGCPVDSAVFPELRKAANGGLESEFYAFKIPDSNIIIFQATVRTCRGHCEPVMCSDRSRGFSSYPSWGRKKRAAIFPRNNSRQIEFTSNTSGTPDWEEVRELLQVYLTRSDIPENEALSAITDSLTKMRQPLHVQHICMARSSYTAIKVLILILTATLISMMVCIFTIFKKCKVQPKLMTSFDNPIANGESKDREQPFEQETDFQRVTLTPSFYSNKNLRSITLWNSETK